MQHCDALFVINRDTALLDLSAIQRRENIRSAVVLATHRLLPTEKASLAAIFDPMDCLSFGDLLSDSDMSRCDEEASQQLINEGCTATEDYNVRFMTLSLSRKNEVAHQLLSLSHRFQSVYFAAGLGISTSFWAAVGTPIQDYGHTAEVETAADKPSTMPRFRERLRRSWVVARSRGRPATRQVYVVRDNHMHYMFFGELKRLRVRSWTRATPKRLSVTEIQQLLRKTDVQYCMTTHDYDPSLARNLGGVWIFIDGYHPSNYPRTYIDSYGLNDVFVVRTMFDERWFQRTGRRTLKPPMFLEREYFRACNVQAVARVLIALNHAGDWTALINRSDTDDLVIASAEIARNLPRIEFRIRLHPTMSDPRHEGANASERLTQFVRQVACANLNVSRDTLLDDLAWCDACVSEYSQVLLDALRSGKLGIALNMTRRRSFMQDYADVGFFHLSSVEGATQKLRWIRENPSDAIVEQNKAVDRYNKLLAEWLGESVLEKAN